MNILAIKGGGARGIIVTRFLVEIENITKTPISHIFDYIGGSSVGALITCGILMSDDGQNPVYTAKQVHETFLKYMTSAFSWTYSSYASSFFGLMGPSYTNVGLIDITKDLCKDRILGNLLKPIIFPAYDRLTQKAYYFERDKDKEIQLSKVIMSCTAAPTYFPSYKMEIDGKKYDMIDGGVVVNNTAELVFLQSTKHLECINKSKILEVNIGTGVFVNCATEKNGLLTWIPMIVNTLMNGCNENELFELSLSLPKENYFIMDVPIDIKYSTIDDVRKSTMDYYLNETEKWITKNMDLMKKFCYKLLQNKNLQVPDDLQMYVTCCDLIEVDIPQLNKDNEPKLQINCD